MPAPRARRLSWDKSVMLLSMRGEAVTVLDSVSVDDPVVHVTFTPDGRGALAAKFVHHRVMVLEIANDNLTYAKRDMTVGLKPINIDITPDGTLALVANVGEVPAIVHEPVDATTLPVHGRSVAVAGRTDASAGIAFEPSPRDGSLRWEPLG